MHQKAKHGKRGNIHKTCQLLGDSRVLPLLPWVDPLVRVALNQKVIEKRKLILQGSFR